MGGVESSDWHLEPEQPAVFVGTQDMLLSRALNRGYASARARWPIDFGLLNQDCLWVMDEVQLMDVALVTSVQLQTYRQTGPIELRPCCTWWMSATLQVFSLHTPESVWLPALEQDMVQVPPPGGPRHSPATAAWTRCIRERLVGHGRRCAEADPEERGGSRRLPREAT
jgi:CRISPR-associated endonuclease/helicase Cas3